MSRNLQVDHDAPLPLGYHAALDMAVRLRESNPTAWTWLAISEAMRVYHGFDRAESWWRRELRGRVVARPRGNAYRARVLA